MAYNIIGFQVGFSWSDVKIFTVLALKDGSTMALQSVNFKKALKGKPTLQCTSDLNLAVQKSSPYSLKIYLYVICRHHERQPSEKIRELRAWSTLEFITSGAYQFSELLGIWYSTLSKTFRVFQNSIYWKKWALYGQMSAGLHCFNWDLRGVKFTKITRTVNFLK